VASRVPTLRCGCNRSPAPGVVSARGRRDVGVSNTGSRRPDRTAVRRGSSSDVRWEAMPAETVGIIPRLAPSFQRVSIFCSLGIGLWSASRHGSTRIRYACAPVVMLIAALTGAQYAFQIDQGLDQVLFRDTSSGELAPGRMPPATTLTFLLVANVGFLVTAVSLFASSRSWRLGMPAFELRNAL
jgi:hypothetical protein